MPWAVGGLLATLMLSGCQAEETPPAGASPSAGSGSASASPSPTSPSPSASPSSAVPPAAREKSEAGAEAFVRYFFDQVNVAWTEPRPGLIASLSDPACEFCADVEQTSVDLAQQSERYNERAVSLGDVARRAGAPQDQYFFEVLVIQHAAEVVDQRGKVVRTDEAGQGASLVGVKWTQEGWRLLGVEVA
jgi:hypothetical protein